MSKTKDEENCDGIIGADNNNFDEQTLQNYTNTNFKR